jgi:hypothetical protein
MPSRFVAAQRGDMLHEQLRSDLVRRQRITYDQFYLRSQAAAKPCLDRP